MYRERGGRERGERDGGREGEREKGEGGRAERESTLSLTIPYEVQKMMTAIAKNIVNEFVWISGCLF